MKRMLIGSCLAICLVCGVVEVRADCSGIDDPYLKSEVRGGGAKGLRIIRCGHSGAEHDKVQPQYSGSPGLCHGRVLWGC